MLIFDADKICARSAPILFLAWFHRPPDFNPSLKNGYCCHPQCIKTLTCCCSFFNSKDFHNRQYSNTSDEQYESILFRFIHFYVSHSCLFLSIRQLLPPADNAGGSRQNSRNSSAFFGNIDPLNTNLSASFESTEIKIDAAAKAFSTILIAG